MQSLSTHHQGISLFVHLLLNHQVPKTFWQVKAVPKQKIILFKVFLEMGKKQQDY